jgi:hypothetical protein
MLAMQGGLEAAEAIDGGLRAGDVSARAFARYERVVRRRYHHFRRFAIGFYDPSFRELWYSRPPLIGIYHAIVSVLAGNWRPSAATRARIAAFFAVVAVKRALRRLGRGRRVRS